ncbi:MAG: methyltransferase domain-containing protein [Sandaracinaceae bacterium]
MGLEAELEAETEAARAYEALLVPELFGEWASKVADAAALRPGHRVLDVACGTGVLSREARARVGPRGSVTGLDPGRGMLAVAADLDPEDLPPPGAGPPGDARREDAAFDRVVSQFGLIADGAPSNWQSRVRESCASITLWPHTWDSVGRQPSDEHSSGRWCVPKTRTAPR